jgi:fructokinase
MPANQFTVVGVGEVLWDLLPSGKQLGGAPANFAYMTSLQGDLGIVASSLGGDELGDEVVTRLAGLGLSTDYLQRDPAHPTGSVKVQIDGAGQPRYQIIENVAWDFLQWTPQWQQVARSADAVCFGSLAQRSPRSRLTIRAFLQATRREALRVFDVNLRQSFYSPDILAESFQQASLVKLNHEELPRVMHLLGLSYDGDVTSAERLLRVQNLKLICVTRGDNGSVLAGESGTHAHPGFPVRVVDTIGSGDAFTAALVHHYLREASLQEMNEAANRMGAWVASCAGATPVPGTRGLADCLARMG